MLMAAALATTTAYADDDLPNFNAPVDNTPLNVDKVNRIMGLTMFQAPSLWDEDDGAVARRFGWPQESLTSMQSSFRLYPTQEKPVNILGARAYSCVLYATKGRPTEISIVFVNEGDYEWTQNYIAAAKKLQPNATPDISLNGTTNAPDSAPDVTTGPENDLDMLRLMNPDDRERVSQDVHDAFEKALKQDTQTLTDGLTKLFGDPQHMGFGGGDETRERVLRWDWQGHAFLLSSPKGRLRHAAHRADRLRRQLRQGRRGRPRRAQNRARPAREAGDSGDVVVTDIPMVDQDPRAIACPPPGSVTCATSASPPTCTSLANAAGTTQLGTNLDNMVLNVDSLVTLYHRRIDALTGDLDLKTVAKNIDAGLPIMWCCYIHLPFRAHHEQADARPRQGHRLGRLGRKIAGQRKDRNPRRDHRLGHLRRPPAHDHRL